MLAVLWLTTTAKRPTLALAAVSRLALSLYTDVK